MTVPLPLTCTPGAWSPCPYGGPAGTQNVGICQAGTNYCKTDGTDWNGCMGEVQPSLDENCTSVFDDNCNGMANESGLNCTCMPGVTKTGCYTGPQMTAGAGVCVTGTSTCRPKGNGYGPCEGQVVPAPETCATPGDDDDCDNSTACIGVPVFAKRYAAAASQVGYGIAVDANGNMVVVGYFSGTLDFTGGISPLTSAGGRDVFVAKLDKTGRHIWSKRFGDAAVDQYGLAVAFDNAGNVVITGRYYGGISFDNGMTTLMSAGNDDIFVAKLSGANGSTLFGKRYGGAGIDQGKAITVDATNNIYVTGFFTNTVDFATGPLVSMGGRDAFVLRLSSTGTLPAVMRFGDAQEQQGNGIAWSSSNVYVTGTFTGAAFGLTAVSSPDVFLASLDPATLMTNATAKQFGITSGGYFGVEGLAASAQGVVITGSYDGDVNFGGMQLTDAMGFGNGFVAKFNSGLGHVWSSSFGDGAGFQTGYGAAINAAGDVTIAGSFDSTADFGGVLLTDAGSGDIFVARYDTNGMFKWAKQFGDSNLQHAFGVKVDANDNVLLTGGIFGTVDFGKGGLTGGVSDFDLFVVKLTP
jgi:hypothetical protein